MKNLKFSIITPSHDPDNVPYLIETFESICDQIHENWEWILYLNNKCLPKFIPPVIKNHPKVRLFHAYTEQPIIGLIKKEAFSIGTGDVLVELDHDDLLTPDCLSKLNIAYQDETVGFVYSDNASFKMDGEFIPYMADNGWTYRTFNWKGRDLIAMNSFEPTSHSLSYIWYAPDHVRSWRRTTYHEIGGHNIELEVCDDHELCIRTYLHTKMVRIPEVLYIYRITGNNTSINHRNELIQSVTYYSYNGIFERRNLFILNISSFKVYINIYDSFIYTTIKYK
jgi:glycosyltransferase involved in cell wall biosynthesis